MDIFELHERLAGKKWFHIIATSVLIAMCMGEVLLFGDVADLFSRPEPPAFFASHLWRLLLIAAMLYVFRTQVYSLVVYGKFDVPEVVDFGTFFSSLWHPRTFRLLLDTLLQQILFMQIIEELRSCGIAPAWVVVLLGLFVIPYYFIRGLFYDREDYSSREYSRWLLLRMLWWFTGGVYYGLMYYWSGGILLPFVTHFIRNFMEWWFDCTPVRIILQINGDEGRVYIEAATEYRFPQTYKGGEPDEWLPLEGKGSARKLADWASEQYEVPVVESYVDERVAAEAEEIAVSLS